MEKKHTSSRGRFRSDSSVHSSKTWQTSASQSTTKRTHTGQRNAQRPTRKNNQRTNTQADEILHSPPQVRRYGTTNRISTPKQRPNDQSSLPSSSSVASNSNSTSSRNSSTSQRFRPKGVGTKPERKVGSPSIRKPPGSKNGKGIGNKVSTRRRESQRKTNDGQPQKQNSNSEHIKQMKRKNDIIGQKNQVPVETIHVSPSTEADNNTHHSHKEKLNEQELIKTDTMNKEEEYEQQLFVPEHNLHLYLENCAWEELYYQLKDLSTKATRIQAEINVSSMDDATVLHTAVWKAPAGLALIMIKLLPIQDEKENIFLKQDKDGNTPIHLLCGNMAPFFDENSSQPILDISVLELLIKHAPEALEIRNKEGDTPLHLFVTSPAASASTLLSCPPPVATVLKGLKIIYDNLSNQESIVAKDNQGATPFHSAIACQADESILMALLDYSPAVVKIGDGNGLLPLHYAAALLQTPAPVVERICQLYQYGLCHKTADGDTPLHLLVRNSAEDVIFDEENHKVGKTKLLNRNAIKLLEFVMGNSEIILPSTTGQGDKFNEDYDPFFIANNECLTPLHCCALFNASIQVTQLLVGHPSAHRAALSTNRFGATPLHLAAAQPNVSVDIAMAIGNANTDAAVVQDNRKHTPLHLAVQNKNATTGLIECIVDLNPEACEITDSGGNVPLHLAIQSESKDHVVETLLRVYPKGKQFKNKLLDTPLHDAAMNNNISVEIIRLLIDQYHEALCSQNSFGDVPLHCAASSQIPQPDVIEVLLEASPNSASIQNNKGDCPLHTLVGHTSVSITILRLFMDVAKSSICILNKNNQTPLEKAKEKGTSDEVIELLSVWFEEQSVEEQSDG